MRMIADAVALLAAGRSDYMGPGHPLVMGTAGMYAL